MFETEKVNILIELHILKLISNFTLIQQLWFFWVDLPKKGFYGLKQKKWTPLIFFLIDHIQIDHHHWILHIQSSLGSKFQRKLTILIFFFFLTRFSQKGFFNIFYIILHIQISLARNFSSNWQFTFFRSSLPKKVFPVKNRKSEHHHRILHIWIILGAKF